MDQLKADAEAVHAVREEMTAKLRAAIKKGKGIEKEAALLRPLPEKVAQLQVALDDSLAAAAAAGAAARDAEDRLEAGAANLAAAESRAAAAEAAVAAAAGTAAAGAEELTRAAAEAGRRVLGKE